VQTAKSVKHLVSTPLLCVYSGFNTSNYLVGPPKAYVPGLCFATKPSRSSAQTALNNLTSSHSTWSAYIKLELR
jgi:hypothetical protein